MALLLQIQAQTIFSTSMSILPADVTGTQILVRLDTMPGNRPAAYRNTLFLWQAGAQIVPINTPPQDCERIDLNQPDGSWLFMGLDISSEAYLVCLALGDDPANIVSTVFIPADPAATAFTAMNSSIEVINVMSTSVAFSYATPTGQMPKLQDDWVGLWEELSEGALYSEPPTWSAQMGSNAAQGHWSLNAVSGGIRTGTPYTLGYFKGGWRGDAPPAQTTLACSTTFVA